MFVVSSASVQGNGINVIEISDEAGQQQEMQNIPMPDDGQNE